MQDVREIGYHKTCQGTLLKEEESMKKNDVRKSLIVTNNCSSSILTIKPMLNSLDKVKLEIIAVAEINCMTHM